MEFICLGSGSTGNAYIIRHNKRCILVECGIRFKTLIQKLNEHNININDIKGVLITHKHKDHSIAKEQFIKCEIPVFEPYLEDLPKTIQIDWLIIYCFRTYHDVDSCGFVFINSITKKTMLFINDTNYFELEERLQQLKYDYVAIECNHVYSKLLKLMEESTDGKKLKFKRQAVSHLSLISTKKMLNQLCLDNTKAIFLMHLSQEASDPEIMKKTIQNTFNKTTYVCLKDGGLL